MAEPFSQEISPLSIEDRTLVGSNTITRASNSAVEPSFLPPGPAPLFQTPTGPDGPAYILGCYAGEFTGSTTTSQYYQRSTALNTSGSTYTDHLSDGYFATSDVSYAAAQPGFVSVTDQTVIASYAPPEIDPSSGVPNSGPNVAPDPWVSIKVPTGGGGAIPIGSPTLSPNALSDLLTSVWNAIAGVLDDIAAFAADLVSNLSGDSNKPTVVSPSLFEPGESSLRPTALGGSAEVSAHELSGANLGVHHGFGSSSGIF